MASNRENISGRGHGNGHQHNGRLGRGSHATVTHLSPEAKKMLSYGLSLVGFGKKRQKCREALSIRRFRAHYDIGPGAVKQLASDLKKNYEEPINLPNLFMALHWLKLYSTEEVMAGRWGHGEQYCRETTKKYVKQIRSMKSQKITFRGLHPKCRFAPVDCVHIICYEFRCDPDSKWWSHKSNGPGVSFEVVTDPVDGHIRWVNGPEPASTHDLTFLRGGKKGKEKEWKKSSLYFNLPKGLRLVGDSAYEGQPDKVSTTNDAHDPATKELFARMKSLQETLFKRLKDFKVVRGPFRHGQGTEDKLEKIKLCFEACLVLVQYDIENGHPLFQV